MDVAALFRKPNRQWYAVEGAAEHQLERLQTLSSVVLPEELLQLLRYSNGGEGDLAIPPGSFVLDPIEEIIACLERPFEREEFPGFLFFGGNGAGERLALDMRVGCSPWPVVMIDPIAGQESAEQVAESFAFFVEAIGVERS